jgi:hypothetical protein
VISSHFKRLSNPVSKVSEGAGAECKVEKWLKYICDKIDPCTKFGE